MWVAGRASDLIWVGWEQDYSVFDRGTGMTHLLNEFPAEIVRILSTGPLTAAELAERLASDCDTDNDALWLRRVEETLSQLAALDLLESRDACA